MFGRDVRFARDKDAAHTQSETSQLALNRKPSPGWWPSFTQSKYRRYKRKGEGSLWCRPALAAKMAVRIRTWTIALLDRDPVQHQWRHPASSSEKLRFWLPFRPLRRGVPASSERGAPPSCGLSPCASSLFGAS